MNPFADYPDIAPPGMTPMEYMQQLKREAEDALRDADGNIRFTDTIYKRPDGYYSADQPVTADDYRRAVGRIGRDYAPAILFDLRSQKLMPDDVLPAIVGDAWNSPDNPERCVEPGLWAEWFRASGLRNEAGEPVERPDTLQVFRGASIREARTGVYGMSWTTDPERAAWFAYEHNQAMPNGVVYSAIVPGSVLLADLRDGERGESEVVLDTRHRDWPTVSILPSPDGPKDA